MTWYTASLVTALWQEGREGPLLVFEDTMLIEAKSRDEGLSIAESMGKELESLDDDLRVDGKTAKRIFLGTRKLRSVYNEGSDIDQFPPSHRTELTHSLFEVESLEKAKELAMGKRVTVSYVGESE